MKYEFGQTLEETNPVDELDNLVIYLGELDGQAVVQKSHWDDKSYITRNELFVFPYENIIYGEDEWEIIDYNHMISMFPVDIKSGDFIEDCEGAFYKVLGIKPIFYPDYNKCELLVQNMSMEISAVLWAEIILESNRDNAIFSQNLNVDKYWKVEEGKVQVEINKTFCLAQPKLKKLSPGTFSFPLNTGDLQTVIQDINDIEINDFINDSYPEGFESEGISFYHFECQYAGDNKVNVHLNRKHLDCMLPPDERNNNYCSSIQISCPSGKLRIANNEKEIMRISTSEKVLVTVHREIEYHPSRWISRIDIYLDGVLENQF